ncbi:hypothetical protein ES707_15064 [subsurface metagenome]
MVAADANRIPPGNMLGTKLNGIANKPHRWFREAHESFLGNKLLQHIILNCPAYFIPAYPLFFGRYQIHSPERRGRWVYCHGSGYFTQRYIFSQDFKISQGINSHPALAHFSLSLWRIAIIAH